MCDKCQYAKPSGPGHDLLLNYGNAGAPWDEVAVDLIGPWPVSTSHDVVEFFALTSIDTTTNHVDITRNNLLNLVTMLLLVLSSPGVLGILDQSKSMTMEESSQVIPFNSCHAC